MKREYHSLLVLVVFFDLILLMVSYFMARYFAFLVINPLKFNIKEVMVSSIVILILYIGLENFEFSHSYRFQPIVGLFKSVVYFELFLLSVFYLVKILIFMKIIMTGLFFFIRR